MIAYEKEQLIEWCNESDSYNEVLVKSGRTRNFNNREVLKKYILLYGINVDHFTHSTNSYKYPRPKTELSESGSLRECPSCHKMKDTEKDYYRSNKKTHWVCKDCVRASEREKYAIKAQHLNAIKSNSKCIKCGEPRVYLLDFHHRDTQEKDFTISWSMSKSIKVLDEEVKKCDILCSNCHREWHYLNSHFDITYDDWLLGRWSNGISADC